MGRYLNEEEKESARMCISNIEDKLLSIKNEISLNMSYKNYLLEKLQPILNDTKCLINICEEENNVQKFKRKM